MTSFEAIEERLLSAGTVPEALGAGWAAFEWVRVIADSFAVRGTAHFVTWLSVVSPACEGRDAVGFAPSMPGAAAGLAGPPDLAGAGEAEAAVMIAGLTVTLRERLHVAAGAAREPGDVDACVRGSVAAAEIGELFAAV
jgi:hypothetical protein